jgi:hypothetical protein
MKQCFFIGNGTTGDVLIVVEPSEMEAAKWGPIECRVPDSVARLMEIDLDRCGAYLVDKIEATQILVP